MSQRILVTGCAGFIGSHAAEHLLAQGARVRGLDNMDDYYDPRRKSLNLERLLGRSGFEFQQGDVRRAADCERATEGVDQVLHLAARAGVRVSIDDPVRTYDTNVTGTLVLLEAMRKARVRKIVFGSTSSVYGGDAPVPFREEMPSSRPLSPYAASKRACELLIASYVQVHGLGAIILRLFTVYGPRGRPDMSVGRFVEAVLNGKQVPLHGDGSVTRDFTHVDDVCRGLIAAVSRTREAELELANLGGSERVSVRDLISHIEAASGKTLLLDRRPPAPGDSPTTWANIDRARALLGWEPRIRLPEGIALTVDWARKALQAHPTIFG